MKIIDRYLLRQFLKTFLVCYVSLTGLYIVFDAFTNLEEFMRCSKDTSGVLALLGSFYAYQSVVFFDRTAGLLSLVAAMFTVSWIQRHHEMTALMAAGISRIRIVTPVIAAAVIISLFATVNRELMIPRFRDQLTRRPQDLIGDVAQPMRHQYDHLTKVLMRGKSTYGDRQRIEKPDFLLPDALADYGTRLEAKNAFYKPPEGNRPGGYLLENVTQPKDLAKRPSLSIGPRAVLITSRDQPEWLEPNQCFVVSDVTFEQLTGGRAFRQFASTAELIVGLRNPSQDFGADVRVAIHSRFVNPLLDVTLLFLGLPLVVVRESRNVFIAIGMCMGVTTLFLLVVIAFQHLGAIYLISPALAAWAPLMLFVPAAVALSGPMWERGD